MLTSIRSFDFGIVSIGGVFQRAKHDVGPVTLSELKHSLESPQNLASNTSAWATVFGENHDQPRSV
jgi:glycosidase